MEGPEKMIRKLAARGILFLAVPVLVCAGTVQAEEDNSGRKIRLPDFGRSSIVHEMKKDG